ncbi:MAG TPA: hypothetical protein VF690_01215 [Hymenobacter sp.]|jgi:hypothetical protein
MTYNPVYFQGDIAQEIHSAVLEANRTAERKLLRVEDNIKFERVLTSISGGVKWQAYKEKIREADLDALTAGNDWKFGDRKLTPKKIMALDNVTMDQLRKTRFSRDMAAGANNLGSTEFEQSATAYLIPRMGKSYEQLQYGAITAATKAQIAASATPTAPEKAWAAAQESREFDGIIASAILAGVEDPANKTKVIVGTTLTSGNAVAEYSKIYAAIDPAELEAGMVYIYAPLSDLQILTQANTDSEFKDKFTITGRGKDATVLYNNVPVEFVPTGTVRLAGYGGETGDFVFGTDLLSDTTEFKIDKVNAMSDDLFFKMVATGCGTVLNASKKVLYI